MILDTNILHTQHQADLWLWRGTVSALVLASVAGLWLGATTANLSSESEKLEGELGRVANELQVAEERYRDRMKRLPAGIDKSLESLSRLPAYRGQSSASLLYHLEKRLPREVFLSRLRHDRAQGRVTLEARTDDGRSVSRLLTALGEVDGAHRVRMLGQERTEDGAIVVTITFSQGRDNAPVQ